MYMTKIFRERLLQKRILVVSGENNKKKNTSKSECCLKIQMIEANGDIWVMMKAIEMWE